MTKEELLKDTKMARGGRNMKDPNQEGLGKNYLK